MDAAGNAGNARDGPEDAPNKIVTYWPTILARIQAGAPHEEVVCGICRAPLAIAGATFPGLAQLEGPVEELEDGLLSCGRAPALVFPCGHFFCVTCVRMCRATSGVDAGPPAPMPAPLMAQLRCPACRQAWEHTHRRCRHTFRGLLLPVLQGECVRCLVPPLPVPAARWPRVCWACRAYAVGYVDAHMAETPDGVTLRWEDVCQFVDTVREVADATAAAAPPNHPDHPDMPALRRLLALLDAAVQRADYAAQGPLAPVPPELLCEVRTHLRSIRDLVGGMSVYGRDLLPSRDLLSGRDATSSVADWSHDRSAALLDRRTACTCRRD